MVSDALGNEGQQELNTAYKMMLDVSAADASSGKTACPMPFAIGLTIDHSSGSSGGTAKCDWFYQARHCLPCIAAQVAFSSLLHFSKPFPAAQQEQIDD